MKTKIAKKINYYLAIIMIAIFCLPLNLSLALDIQLTDEELLESTDPEFQKIKQEITENQKKLEELQKQQKVYEENLKIKRNQISSLRNQLEILSDSIAKLIVQMEATELSIKQTDLEIKNTQILINYKEKEILNQQQKLAEVLRLIEEKDRKQNNLEILIVEGSLSNFLNEINKLESLNDSLKDQLNTFKDLRADLEQKKQTLLDRQDYLAELKNELEAQQEKQADEQRAKGILLEQTRGQEKNFQSLLSQARQEQAAIEGEIQSLEVEARKKLLEQDGNLPENEEFIWPVPSRKVTAGFHDPDYPFRYIFEHPAIDIGSTPQGTPIRATKSGYVARVKSDGTSAYAYIMIVHTSGLSTVYGHVSKAMVEEDSYVVQGQIIALSGGSPGTAGAGKLTTAPHLHFEVRLNGIPVNPLDYLP